MNEKIIFAIYDSEEYFEVYSEEKEIREMEKEIDTLLGIRETSTKIIDYEWLGGFIKDEIEYAKEMGWNVTIEKNYVEIKQKYWYGVVVKRYYVDIYEAEIDKEYEEFIKDEIERRYGWRPRKVKTIKGVTIEYTTTVSGPTPHYDPWSETLLIVEALK